MYVCPFDISKQFKLDNSSTSGDECGLEISGWLTNNNNRSPSKQKARAAFQTIKSYYAMQDVYSRVNMWHSHFMLFY
ncbi:hypothetical protein Bhyg_02067 [Pseudolycoriella hygida]|uniref:Uncharacterized protein n=1 Tax=Pseudolycoriella hygida TaxID=35572 RepID=A0A9Q0S7F2_9DIPT|nr:hypothetical protein Bhyg_02067 [Pseudolycoriella hygida]